MKVFLGAVFLLLLVLDQSGKQEENFFLLITRTEDQFEEGRKDSLPKDPHRKKMVGFPGHLYRPKSPTTTPHTSEPDVHANAEADGNPETILTLVLYSHHGREPRLRRVVVP